MELLVPLILFGLLWALLILPQQRRVRAQQQMQNALQPGDEVVTSAGIYGRVTLVESDSLLLEVAPGIELRMARGAVGRRLEPEEAAMVEDADEDEEADVDADADQVGGPPAIPPADAALPPEVPGGPAAPRRDDA